MEADSVDGVQLCGECERLEALRRHATDAGGHLKLVALVCDCGASSWTAIYMPAPGRGGAVVGTAPTQADAVAAALRTAGVIT